MFAIILRYVVPVHEVDRHADAHLAWLRKHYRHGHFLLSGQQRPRVGGFILAANMGTNALQEILAQDPYVKSGVGNYEIIEFNPRFLGEQLLSSVGPQSEVISVSFEE